MPPGWYRTGDLDAADTRDHVLVAEPGLHLNPECTTGERELDRTGQYLVLRVGGDEGAIATVDERAHLHQLDDALVGADDEQVQALELYRVIGSGGVEDANVGLNSRLVLQLKGLVGRVIHVLVARERNVDQIWGAI